MVLGQFGLVVALLLFFSWRKSKMGWQRVVAWLAAAWIVFSIFIYLAVFFPSFTSPTSYPPTASKPAPTIRPKTAIPFTKTPTKVRMLGYTGSQSDINIRSGPGVQFAKIRILRRDGCVYLDARNQDGSWLYVSIDQRGMDQSKPTFI